MAKSKTSEIVYLKNGRGSFLRLDKPKAFQEGQDPRFEGTLLLDPSNADHAQQIAKIKAVVTQLIKDQWGEKPVDLKLCFGLADLNPTKAKYDGYKGMFYLVMANTTRPTVVGRNLQPVVAGDKEFPYSGSYGNTNPTFWAQDNKFGKAIRANLRIWQFVKDGPAFSGSAPANAEEEFQALGDAPKAAGAVEAVADAGFDL